MTRPASGGREAGEREPAAYLHILHMEDGQTWRKVTFDRKHPFGTRGKDYSPEYHVTTTPLYARKDPDHA